MEVDVNKITKTDRACINCKYLKRRWTPSGIISLIVSKIMNTHALDHLHCARSKSEIHFNSVTGKQTIIAKTQSCFSMRSADCGWSGALWEPSERWKKNPDNLFKMLTRE
jgi:hypothetical protein